ncbi:hypothetical protein Pelo_19263 [Pelomyxa schiedti]|nr:hypothetical protein Pelo_19263 [Pelomyxa schiedti]
MYKRRGPARDPDRSLFHPGEAAEYWDPSITHRQVQAAADAEKQAEDEAQAGEPTRRLPLPADWVGEGLWPGQALDGAAHKYVAVLSRRAGPGEGGRPPGQRAEGVYEVGSVVSSSGGSNLDVVFLGCPCHTKMESVPWNYIYHISPPPSVTQLYDPVTVGKWFALALLHGQLLLGLPSFY